MHQPDQPDCVQRSASRAFPYRLWIVGAIILLGIAGVVYSTVAMAAHSSEVSIQQIAVTDPTNSLQPQVAADSANNLHVVWYDGADIDRAVKYAKGTFNGATYSWSGPFDVYKPGGTSTFIHPRLTVDGQNQVHVVWGWNNTIYYKRWAASSLPAQGTTPLPIGAGLFPAIAVDTSNHLHIVWESSVGGNYEILYRKYDGAQFSAEQNISKNGGDSLSPDIALDSTGTPNVTWYDKTTGTQTVFYTRQSGVSWPAGTSISGPDSVFPSIAADGQGCVHLAWSSISTNSIVYRKACSGQLQGSQTVGATASPRRAAIGTSSSGKIVVAWDSPEAGPANIYTTQFNGSTWSAPTRLAPASGSQLWSDVTGLPNGNLVVVWEEIVSGQFDPAFAIISGGGVTPPPTPTPTPPALTGSLQVDGGAPFTRQASVSVVINNTSSTPATSYSLADDADPGTPGSAFSNPGMTVPFTLNVSDGRCRAHAVNGRLGGGGGVSPIFSDAIVYDPSAQASVRAQNPNSALNLPLTGVSNALVPTGDLAYTRQERLTVLIMPPVEECSGLKRYAIVQHSAPAPAVDTWSAVDAAGYASDLTFFTASQGQGQYQFDVYVEDNAGNTAAAPYVVSIVYDTEGPTVSGALTGLPTTSSAKGGVATIDLGARTVADNLYQGPTADQSYWGYWVAVKATAAGEPTESEWNQSGQIVAGQISGPIAWNMARGLIGTFQAGTGYTVYIRLLDGAGNWSQTLASQSVTVQQLEFFGNLPLTQR